MKKIVAGVIVLLAVLFYVEATQFRAVDQIMFNGYALVDGEMEDYLKGEDVNTNKKQLSLIEVEQQEDIYEQMGSYYVGEEKVEVSLQYPLYFNDYQALSFLSDNGALINDEFQELQVTQRTILNNGTLYSQTQQKIDDSVFLFYRADSGVFMNSVAMQVKTLTQEDKIPENSIVYFTNEDIRYYEPKGDHLNFRVILSVGEHTTITMNQQQYSYGDFLKKLGLLEDEKDKEDMQEEEDAQKEEEGKDQQVIEVKPEIQQPSNQTNTHTEDKGEGEQKDDSLQEEVPNVNEPSNDANHSSFKAPKVSIGEYTSTVYSISSHIEIEDPQARLKSKRVTVEIWNEGRIIMRKFFKETQDFTIQGVPPSSQLKIKTKYTYKDANGEYIEKELEEKEIRTKSIDTLSPIQLRFKNGEIFSDHIIIKDFEGDVDKEHEGLKNINHIVVSVDGHEYPLSSVQLIQFMSKEKVQVKTAKNLKSNSQMDYEFYLYDRFNNALKVENSTGTTRTCKSLPSAKIRVETNKVNDVKLLLNLENPDDLDLKDYRIRLTDIYDQEVDERMLKEKDDEISFENLPENTLIKYQLLASFDTENNQGMQKDQVLSKGQFTTTPLSSLGNITMVTSIENKDITSNSITMQMKISDNLTSNQLLMMMKEAYVVLLDEEGKEIDRILIEQLDKLIQKETIAFKLDDLDSKTKYNFRIEAIIRQADEDHVYNVNCNLSSFQTLKKDALVVVKDGHVIRLKDSFNLEAYVYDPDGSVINGLVSMTVSNGSDRVRDARAIYVSDKRLSYDDENWVYYEYHKAEDPRLYLRFKAKEYNVRYTNVYRKLNHSLTIEQKDDGSDDDTRYSIEFAEGASGRVNLLKVTKTDTKSYVDMDIIMVDTGNINKDKVYLRVYKDGEEQKQFTQKIDSSSFAADKTLTLHNYRLDVGNNERYTICLEADEIDPATGEYVTKTFDSVEVETYENLIPIENEEEFYRLITEKPDASFLVLNNLDFTNDPNKIIEVPFTGTIDFQGKKVIQSVNDDVRYLFKENNGTIKNVDFHLSMNNQERIDSIQEGVDGGVGGLVHTNNGTIQNIIFTFEKGTPLPEGMEDNKDILAHENPRNNHGVGGIIYSNKGTLDNFVIHAKDALTINGYGAYGVAENKGIVQNGYAYPEVKGNKERVYLDATYQNRAAGQLKSVGAIVGYNAESGTIQQVYSLVNVVNDTWDTFKEIEDSTQKLDELAVGVVVGTNAGTVKKVYGYDEGTATYTEKAEDPKNHGPIVGVNTGSQTNEETYYLSEHYHANQKLNKRISNLTASDYEFHEATLNKDGAFAINDFVIAGYFPQINLPSYFTKQPMCPLPPVNSDEAIELRSINVVSQSDNSAIVDVDILNPGSGDITKIVIDDIEKITVLSQKHEDRRTLVRIKIEDPTGFYSGYSIREIVARNNFSTGANVSIKYEPEEKVIDVDFYRYIANVEDWKEYVVGDNKFFFGDKKEELVAKTDRFENYKLTADIDLKNVPVKEASVVVYEGIFDGNGHTVRNFAINTNGLDYFESNKATSRYRGLFQYIHGGIIKNVTFENFSGKYLAGTFYSIRNNPVEFDHVYVKGFTLGNDNALENANISPFIVGVADTSPLTIRNCGVIDASIKGFAVVPSRIGGLITSSASKTYVDNSFVTNFHVDLPKGTYNGIGALIANNNYLQEVKNCYTSGIIKSSTSTNFGMVAWANNNGPIFKNCYSNMKIEAFTASPDYPMAGIAAYAKYYENVLSVGDIKNTALLDDLPFFRIGRSGTPKNNKNVYATEFQKLNGRMDINNLSDAHGLLSYDQLTNKETYQSILPLGDSFDYSYVEKGHLPILKDTSGKILPYQGSGPILSDNRYQKDIYLENIQAISVNDIAGGTIQATLKGLPYDPNTKIISVGIKGNALKVENLKASPSPTNDTILSFDAKLVKAYDSYTITNIVYEYKGKQYTLNCNEEVMMKIFHMIENLDDWKKLETFKGENFKITNDLDFKNMSLEEIGYAHEANRLVGITMQGERKPVIRNLHLSFDGNKLNADEASLFKAINSELSNLRFENCSVYVERAKSGAYKGNDATAKIGLVTETRGTVEDIELYNIQINQSNEDTPYAFGSSVGFIASPKGRIQNVVASKLYVTGAQNVGGIAGNAQKARLINIQVDDSKVQGANSVGTIAGAAHNSNAYNRYIKVTDSIVECAPYIGAPLDNNYFGGVFGYVGGVEFGTVDNVKIYIENTNPKSADGIRNIGGVTGVNGTIYRMKVSDLEIHAPKAQRVGGVVGDYAYFNPQYNHVDGAKITGKSHVGGIAGYNSHSGSYILSSNIVEDATITAEDGVAGGILGKSNSHDRIYRNVVVNTTVSAEGENGIAGSIAGEMADPTGSGTLQIYDNIVNVDVSASKIAGGIFGRIYTDADINGNNNLVARRNIILGNIDAGSNGVAGGLFGSRVVSDGKKLGNLKADNLARNILAASVKGSTAQALVGNELTPDYFYDTLVHNSVRVNGKGISTNEPIVRVVDKETLKEHNTYLENKGDTSTKAEVYPSGTYTDTKKLEGWLLKADETTNGTFPILNLEGNTTNNFLVGYGNGVAGSGELITNIVNEMYTYTDRGLFIPEDNPAAVMKFSDDIAAMPEVSVYSSGIDTLNVEFSVVEKGLYMTLNHDMDNVVEVRDEVMTLSYDYMQPVTITLYNGEEEQEIVISPEDYQRRVMSFDDEYYYLIDGKLKGKQYLMEKDFIHLYDGLALHKDGVIYDVKTKEVVGKTEAVGVKEDVVALASFMYEEQPVQTFGYFSMVGNTRRNMQIFESDGVLGLVDDDLEVVRDSYVLHEEDSKRYQAVLGTDGAFYNLATKMEIPEDFKNTNIKYMTSGANANNAYVMFEYEDGGIYAFDYINGEVLVDEMKNQNVGFMEYLSSFFETESVLVSLEAPTVFEEQVQQLEEALIKQPLYVNTPSDREEATSNEVAQNNATFKNDSYSAYYDATKHEYVLYNNSELMNEALPEIQSENEKIEASDELTKKYSFGSTTMKVHEQSIPFMGLVVVSIAGISGVLYLLKKKKKEV